ncbi:hypothetical protein QO010_002517 [Caulobacter ginsengisoli]|uniref:Uncharacterized protein n=1 Tax=Caulobacter ginsengisoli TaxID=400775 RepID=A0ABU0IRU8_9CAUL|nr:hypothetical protein [Caulobacter ginsengisoli]MDQ0464733.1 hypothetical protein [Caulobacter ginsengisoli]
MLIEEPEDRWASLRRLFGRRQDHGVVGARPALPPPKPRPAGQPSPARRLAIEWRKWPVILLARDLFLAWYSDWMAYAPSTEIKMSERGIAHEGQILGRLPWSSIARVEVGFVRDKGGAGVVLTPEADVSVLLSVVARTERRLTLVHGLSRVGQQTFIAQIEHFSPTTEIRQPENGGLVAPLDVTTLPDEPP